MNTSSHSKNWQETKFGECFRIKHGYAFKGEYFSDSGSYIVLTPGNFYDEGGFKSKGDKEKYYVGEVPPGFILSKGDLIVAMTEQAEGLLGSSAIVPQSNLYLHNQRLGLVTQLNKEKLDKNFLYYLFNSRIIRNQIRASANGTKIRHTSPDRIYEVKVKLPDIITQQKIFEILSAYDRLIENNTRRIKILEEMARSLYDEWFVKFRFPGYEQTKFVDSELGLIPEGWRITELGELVDIKHGYAFKGEFFSEAPTNDIVLTPGNFAIGGGYQDKKLKYYTGEVPSSFVLDAEDLLVTMTDLSKTGDTLGYPAFVPASKELRFLHNQRLGKVIIRNSNAVGKNLLYYVFCSNSYRHHVLATATGTTVRHTSPDRIRAFRLAISSQEISQEFEAIVDPFRKQTDYLNRKNQNLRNTRDLLLPKLISGEIDLEKLEGMEEEGASSSEKIIDIQGVLAG